MEKKYFPPLIEDEESSPTFLRPIRGPWTDSTVASLDQILNYSCENNFIIKSLIAPEYFLLFVPFMFYDVTFFDANL